MTEDRRKTGSFEDLEVFRRAYKASLSVHCISLSFPAIEQYHLGDQVRRASKSICANLAEGWGRRRSAAEMRRFIAMALGSSDEMRMWIRYCLDLGYIDEATWKEWRDAYQEISRMLQGLLRTWK